MREKPELINGILEQMERAGLSKSEREDAAKPLLYLTKRDLADRFEAMVLSKTPNAQLPQSALYSQQRMKTHVCLQKIEDGEIELPEALKGMVSSAEITSEGDRASLEEVAGKLVDLELRLRNDLIFSPEIAEYLQRRPE